MKITLLTLSIVATAAQLSVAADQDPSKLPPVADKTGVTYATDIQPIFKASCINCHGEQRQKGGLRLDSLEATLKGGDDGEVITTGKSEKSDLVFAVARLDPKKAMPPMRGPGRGRGGPGGPGGPGGGFGGPDGGAGPGGPGGQGVPDGAGGPPNTPPNSPPPDGQPGGDGAPGNPPAGGPPRQGGRGGPQAKPLTADQVGLIRAWIDQGAK